MTFLAHKFPLKYILAPSEKFMGKRNELLVLLHSVFSGYLRNCDKALAKRDTKHHQTLLGDQTFYYLATLFDDVWSCLNSIKHSIKQHETFLLFSCLSGWFGQVYQTCLARAWRMRYRRFRHVEIVVVLWLIFCRSNVWRCLIQHVWTVWPWLKAEILEIFFVI